MQTNLRIEREKRGNRNEYKEIDTVVIHIGVPNNLKDTHTHTQERRETGE